MKVEMADKVLKWVLFGLMVFVFVLAALLWLGVADVGAAPAAGGGDTVSFEAQLESVNCLGWRCAAWVDGRLNGEYVGGTVNGWKFKEGQAVTVTARVRNGKLVGVRVR